MKKTLIIFIFLLIAMVVVFLPEVHGINFKNKMDWLGNPDNIDNEGVLIIVEQDGVSFEKIIEEENANRPDEGVIPNYTYSIPQAYKVFSTGSYIELFVGTREDWFGDLEEGVTFTIEGADSYEIEEADAHHASGRDRVGGLARIYLSGSGARTISFRFIADDVIDFKGTITIFVDTEGTDSGSVGGSTGGIDDSTEEGDEDSINADNVNVIISQGDINYWSREYTDMNGNGYESGAPVIDITMYNTFAESRDIKFYIASEERGLSGECFVDVTEDGTSLEKLEGSEWWNDTNGCNCFVSNTYLSFEKRKTYSYISCI